MNHEWKEWKIINLIDWFDEIQIDSNEYTQCIIYFFLIFSASKYVRYTTFKFTQFKFCFRFIVNRTKSIN